MKISVDGGGFCLPSYKRFGNYTFSLNIMRALSESDRNNSYHVYSFCNRPNDLVLRENVFFHKLFPKFMWMTARVSLDELIVPKKIFLALNQAIPGITPANIISFSHGLSFKLMPHYYPDSYKKMNRQLNRMVKKSGYVIVSSQRVKDEMSKYYSSYSKKIKVIPFGIPFDFQDSTVKRREKFFLYVGMNHPIKNVKKMVELFGQFRLLKKEYNSYRLYLVGPFTGFKRSNKNVRTFAKLKREELKLLYQKAAGYLSTSHYESFNLPALEALSQNCQVVTMESAIIPELAPYTLNATTDEQFIEMMTKVADHKAKAISQKTLHEQFSWQAYVESLTELYKKLI